MVSVAVLVFMVIKARILGLDDWIRELRAADLDKAVVDAGRHAAITISTEADEKRRSLQSRFGSYKKVKLTPARIRTGGRVTVGPRRLAHAAEFGSLVHPVYGRPLLQAGFKRQVWPPRVRGGDDDGHLLTPAIRESEDEIVGRYEAQTMGALAGAFPD